MRGRNSSQKPRRSSVSGPLMTMRVTTITMAFMVVCSFGVSARDWTLQTTSRVSASTMLNTANLSESSLYGHLSLSPEIRANSQRFSFSSALSLSTRLEQVAPETELRTIDLQLYPAEWASIRVGRFRHLPGSASFLSPTNYLLTTDYEALLTGEHSSALLPRDMLQGTLFLRRYFVTATLAPGMAPYPLPDPASPWFPTSDVPQTLSLRYPVGEVMELETISLEESDRGSSVSDISGSVEVGGSFRWLDISTFYFHGQNNAPVFQAELNFPQGLFESYEVIVRPRSTYLDAIGVAGTAVFDRVRLVFDGSYSFNEVFNTDRLSETISPRNLPKRHGSKAPLAAAIE